MANIKAAKKSAKTSEFCRERNNARQSEVKSATRKVLDALAAKDIEGAKVLLREAEAKIARARGKGLFKDNNAARKISRLAKKVALAAR